MMYASFLSLLHIPTYVIVKMFGLDGFHRGVTASLYKSLLLAGIRAFSFDASLYPRSATTCSLGSPLLLGKRTYRTCERRENEEKGRVSYV